MKKLISLNQLKNLLPHLAVVIGFIVVSLAVFYPVLQGKKLIQSDIQQYQGMSKQLQDSRKEGKELYWIDNAFGGMPTYQLGAKYPFDFLTPIHKLFQALPHPTFLVFLYLLGCYLNLNEFSRLIVGTWCGATAYALVSFA